MFTKFTLDLPSGPLPSIEIAGKYWHTCRGCEYKEKEACLSPLRPRCKAEEREDRQNAFFLLDKQMIPSEEKPREELTWQEESELTKRSNRPHWVEYNRMDEVLKTLSAFNWTLRMACVRVDNEELAARQKGINMMGCLDKNGKEIHIEDQVLWITPLGKREDCIVVGIFSETEVQVNPLGEGLPEIVSPTSLEVTASFIETLRGLATNEELLAILKSAEDRMTAERKLKDTKREARAEKRESSGPKIKKETIASIEEDI